jgi:hypothetical protein
LGYSQWLQWIVIMNFYPMIFEVAFAGRNFTTD